MKSVGVAMRHLVRRSVVGGTILLGLMGCSTIYYSIWETLGQEKRDLLRSNIEDVREEQEEVSEQFESALEQIKFIYGFEGGGLEEQYDALKREYDRSVEKADDLRDRIDKVEEISTDLFAEWASELESISDADLRRRSREQLDATKNRYARLESAMERSEEGLAPVLQKFNDQVLFLKHNLNAQAIGSLEVEVRDIEKDVGSLVSDLQASIRQADEFIRELPQ